MASGAGFMIDAINTIKRNRGNFKNRKSKYSKLKELYIGDEQLKTSYQNFSQLPKLTEEEIFKGRKRVVAYYKKRNKRIYATIVIVGVLTTLLFGSIFYYLLS